MSDTVPPYSLEAERSFLGSLMAGYYDGANELRPDDFYSQDHGRIFASAVELLAAGRAPDVVTLYEHMVEAGRSPDLAVLDGMYTGTIPANGQRYAGIVRERATRRRLLRYCQDLHAEAQSALTTADLMDSAMGRLCELVDARVTGVPQHVAETICSHLMVLQERSDARLAGRRLAVTTGLADLDNLLAGGWRPGELVILAARPSAGKSAAALTMAVRAAQSGSGVLFCSMEMRTAELIDRGLSLLSEVPLQAIRTGAIASDQWTRLATASELFAQLPLYVDDQPALTLLDVRAKARAARSRGRVEVLVVDYLQLMKSEGENRTQEVGRLSRGLKALAKELNVTVIALSQLNRGVENRADKRPMMADLRESGDIEADADTILMLYREDQYNRESKTGEAEIGCVKQRAGATGIVNVAFRGEITRFDNLSQASAPRSRSYAAIVPD